MRLPRAVLVLVVLAALALLGWRHFRYANVTAVQRGYEVAARSGCFGCHGPGGLQGFADETGGQIGDVPPFNRDEVESYAKDDGEIREWIVAGMPKRLREQDEAPNPEAQAVLRMPAFGHVLAAGEVDDLVTYVKARSNFHAPDEGPLADGRAVAQRLGCFTCHGPQGRGCMPNPRSLKGYIPAWDGRDFPDLVQDDAELRAWILDGGPPRLRAHPIAKFFLARQAVRMPSYRGRISDGHVDTLVAYIRALRAAAGS